MTTEQFDSLKSALASGLIDKDAASKIIEKHEEDDIREATRAARAHGRQVRKDLGLPDVTPSIVLSRMSDPYRNGIQRGRQQELLPRGHAMYNAAGAHNAALAATDNTRIG